MISKALLASLFSSLTLLWIAALTPTFANTLVADLSLEEVAITTDFNGESLLRLAVTFLVQVQVWFC